MSDSLTGIEAIKALAEMTFVFYRHCLDLGASPSEACGMTKAYIEAALGSSRGKAEE